MKDTQVSRRAVLAGTAAAGALSFTGLPARAEPQWKKFAGTNLEVILAKGPRGDLVQKNVAEFTELTGIKVGSEQIPEQQQRQKAVIELASGKPSFDVIHLSYHVQKRQFEKAGWLADITGYMKDPNLTAPDLVENDFSAAGLAYAKNDKEQMLSLPWSVDYFILYYNKDMFAQKGVKVPQTLDEMLAAAEKLTDEKAGIYGYVGRGLRNANMTLWTNYFLNYGGEFLDAKGNILTDGPEAIEATKYYQRISTKLAPPGLAGFNWMESLAAFAQGARRDVDRRGGLGAWGRRSERVAHRRQGRLCDGAGWSERPIFSDLRRRHRHRRGEQEQGSRLPVLPMGGEQAERCAIAASGRRRAVPQLCAQRRRSPQGCKAAGRVAAIGYRRGEDQ